MWISKTARSLPIGLGLCACVAPSDNDKTEATHPARPKPALTTAPTPLTTEVTFTGTPDNTSGERKPEDLFFGQLTCILTVTPPVAYSGPLAIDVTGTTRCTFGGAPFPMPSLYISTSLAMLGIGMISFNSGETGGQSSLSVTAGYPGCTNGTYAGSATLVAFPPPGFNPPNSQTTTVGGMWGAVQCPSGGGGGGGGGGEGGYCSDDYDYWSCVDDGCEWDYGDQYCY